MKKKLRSIAGNKLVVAIVSIIIGLYLIARRSAALDTLIRNTGILLLIAAAIYALIYFFQKERRSSNLAYAVILGIVGLIFIVKPGYIVKIFPVCIGLLLTLNGIVSLYKLLSDKESKGGNRTVFLVLSALVLVAGILIMLHPGAIADLITFWAGIALLVSGLTDLSLFLKYR